MDDGTKTSEGSPSLQSQQVISDGKNTTNVHQTKQNMKDEVVVVVGGGGGPPPRNTTSSDFRPPPEKNLKQQPKRSRPKRNRKRPISQVHSNDNLRIETTIKRLEMNGKPILDHHQEGGGAEQFIRVVHPYPYTFSSFAKQRWVGRTVLDVYVSEFGSYPKSYYEAAIRQGRILVSDNKVGVDYKIKGKDVLTHIVHRHEPGVAVYPEAAEKGSDGVDKTITTTASAATTEGDKKLVSNLVKVIDETEDLIILDKPGTLPIHPCGGYHLNSLTSILLDGEESVTATTEANKYYNIHRLDRLTSGLVILAKSSEVAKHWSQCIRQRNCQKYYLARVRGKFPINLEGRGVDRLQFSSATGDQKDGSSLPRDGEWTNNIQKGVDEPLLSPIDAARRRNAHGYWITDASGDNLQEKVSLSDFANATNSVDAWLSQLDNGNINCKESSTMLWLHLACPTRISKPKDGVCEAGTFQDLVDDAYLKTVKPAQTSFGVVTYDERSDSTLLLCKPVTGRTHQIRLHCQYLGHPIANDPNYGGDIWYRNDAGKEACTKARILLGNDDTTSNDAVASELVLDRSTADVPASEKEMDQFSGIVQKDEEPIEEFIKRTCVWCARIGGRDVVEHSMLEFMLRSRGIWLHALQYCIGTGDAGDGGSTKACRFRTELPSWACLGK